MTEFEQRDEMRMAMGCRALVLIGLIMAATLTGCAQVIGIEDLPECGNGQRETGEECDDDGVIDGDGCSADCTNELCGQGAFDVYAQTRGAMLITSICQNCHSETLDGGERSGAPGSVNLDYSIDIDTWEDRIRVRALDQSPTPMPPAVTSSLSSKQLNDLRAYLDCR